MRAARHGMTTPWVAWKALLLMLGLVVWAAAPARAEGAASPIRLEALPGAPFTQPVHMAPLPGQAPWLAVVEQVGRVYLLHPGHGGRELFIDLRARVSTDGWEEGLLSIAFAPDYATSRVFYVYHSAAGPRRSLVMRYQADTTGRRAHAGAGVQVLSVPQPYGNHNGGQLAFGPDGMLYVGLGDGGAGGDPHGHGQNLRTLLGAILRLDVSGDPGMPGYRVPPDNPFATSPGGARPEIWAYGLRNPWRFSFDRETGWLIAGDVGQNAWEEVSHIERGGNYGWNIMEGSACFSPATNCSRKDLKLPLTEYGHGTVLQRMGGGGGLAGMYGRSITGGHVYRGRAMASLRGHYLFADYMSGILSALPLGTGALPAPGQAILLAETGLRVSAFGEDHTRELYLLDHGEGRIFRLLPAAK